jgi:hypothetical protein
MSARRSRRRRIDPALSPQELRSRARRALKRGRAWIDKADELYREADRREADADDEKLGEPWPQELCETCKAHKRCALHASRIDTDEEPTP